MAEFFKAGQMLSDINDLMRNILIVPSLETGKPVPVKNTSKEECYEVLYQIQELIKSRWDMDFRRRVVEHVFDSKYYSVTTGDAVLPSKDE